MTLDFPMVLIFLASVYFFVESMAMNCWAKWTFKGPRFRKRTFEIKSSERGCADLDQLLVKDDDIKESGFRLMALKQGHYLVQIPPRAPKMKEDMPFPSFLTGELSIDTDSRRVTFIIRCMPGCITFLVTGLVAFLIPQYLAANYVLMIPTILLWSIILVFSYIFAYDRYIDAFWSVVTEKLGTVEGSN